MRNPRLALSNTGLVPTANASCPGPPAVLGDGTRSTINKTKQFSGYFLPNLDLAIFLADFSTISAHPATTPHVSTTRWTNMGAGRDVEEGVGCGRLRRKTPSLEAVLNFLCKLQEAAERTSWVWFERTESRLIIVIVLLIILVMARLRRGVWSDGKLDTRLVPATWTHFLNSKRTSARSKRRWDSTRGKLVENGSVPNWLCATLISQGEPHSIRFFKNICWSTTFDKSLRLITESERQRGATGVNWRSTVSRLSETRLSTNYIFYVNNLTEKITTLLLLSLSLLWPI